MGSEEGSSEQSFLQIVYNDADGASNGIQDPDLIPLTHCKSARQSSYDHNTGQRRRLASRSAHDRHADSESDLIRDHDRAHHIHHQQHQHLQHQYNASHQHQAPCLYGVNGGGGQRHVHGDQALLTQSAYHLMSASDAAAAADVMLSDSLTMSDSMSGHTMTTAATDSNMTSLSEPMSPFVSNNGVSAMTADDHHRMDLLNDGGMTDASQSGFLILPVSASTQSATPFDTTTLRQRTCFPAALSATHFPRESLTPRRLPQDAGHREEKLVMTEDFQEYMYGSQDYDGNRGGQMEKEYEMHAGDHVWTHDQVSDVWFGQSFWTNTSCVHQHSSSSRTPAMHWGHT